MSGPARIEIGVATVERLLEAQFPHWARRSIAPAPASGTDNAMFRLGAHLAVRLPRVEWAVPRVEKEQTWLPRLAPRLPLPVPVPLGRGRPDEAFPWPWSVCRWVAGATVVPGALADEPAFARDLARFLRALWALDAAEGPAPGRHNFGRGAPLSERDARTRASIGELAATHEAATLIAIWEASLAAPLWSGPPVWIHGDVQPGNLLHSKGRLVGVIDFGGLGVGDPACDLSPAWNLLSPSGRAAFREAAGLDAAAWTRGRGWALSTAAIALPYYRTRQPDIASAAARTLDAVRSDEL